MSAADAMSPEHARLLELPADRAPTAVLDFETTGLYPGEGHRVVEVAVVRALPGDHATPERQVIFQRLVDPERDMPEIAQSIHGIAPEELVGAPTFVDVLPGLAEVLQGAVFVAHNAPFDLGFLAHECALAGVPVPEHGPVVDTLALARHVFGLPRCSLAALAERTQVPQPAAHRAVVDATTTLGVYSAFLDSMALRGMPTVGQLISLIEERQKGGAERQRIQETVESALEDGRELVISYTARNADDGALISRRRIKPTGLRLPYIEAWCFLRGAERVFRLERIQEVWELDGVPDWLELSAEE